MTRLPKLNFRLPKLNFRLPFFFNGHVRSVALLPARCVVGCNDSVNESLILGDQFFFSDFIFFDAPVTACWVRGRGKQRDLINHAAVAPQYLVKIHVVPKLESRICARFHLS